MFRRGIGDIVPLNVPPGSGGALPPNLQAPPVVLSPTLQAFLQGYIGTLQNGAAPSDPTGLTAQAYPTPGAAEESNVYGANGPYVDDVWSNMIQSGFFTGTNPAAIIGRKNAPRQAGGSWGRPEILPDSQLPGPLKRQSQLTNRNLFTKNRYDQQVQQEMKLWQWISEHGGIKSCCRIPELGAPVYDQPPWMVMPSQGEVVQELFFAAPESFQVDDAFTGTNMVLGQIRVPVGYDGVINRVITNYDGDGFTNNSGSIIWRVQAGNRYLRNLGNIQVIYGSLATALLLPLQGNRVVSGQYITVYVNIPIGSPISGGTIQAGLFGWFYPRR